jgi:8-oxo-dGTP pyrophosphatase MutT (NUDIX family)
MDPALLDVATVVDRLATSGATDGRGRHRRDRDETAGWQAATALVLSPGDGGLAAAFIQRVERRGDRWSGQMALPGGKRDPGDPDLAATAARETREEVGLHLDHPLGRLADQHGRGWTGMVATYVFALDERPPLVPHAAEVAAALWIPLAAVFDPGAAVRYRWAGIPFPAIAYGDHIIWGLTHRIIEHFGEVIGLSLPRP